MEFFNVLDLTLFLANIVKVQVDQNCVNNNQKKFTLQKLRKQKQLFQHICKRFMPQISHIFSIQRKIAQYIPSFSLKTLKFLCKLENKYYLKNYNNKYKQDSKSKMLKLQQSQYEGPQNDILQDSSAEQYQKPKKQTKYPSGERNGKWLQQQKYAYFSYLDFLYRKDQFNKKKKIPFLFRTMAFYIKTRNLIQCRSYHQKMEKKYGRIKNILKKGLYAYQRQSYQHYYHSHEIKLQQIYTNKILNTKKPKHQSEQQNIQKYKEQNRIITHQIPQQEQERQSISISAENLHPQFLYFYWYPSI